MLLCWLINGSIFIHFKILGDFILNDSWYSRTEILIGKDNLEILKSAKIVVIGLGGVGGSCAEALCRAGIGNLMIIDNDIISVTNINRQVIATHLNIGKYKVDEMYVRLKSINCDINIITKKFFCLPQNSDFIFDYKPDYIIDAIDTILTKVYLIEKANKEDVNFISCMGMGNRLDPSLIRYGSISQTVGSGCVVARAIRSQLRKRNISCEFNVVYSLEKPKKVTVVDLSSGRHLPGSFQCVTSVAGCFLASKVVNDLILKR